MAVYFSFGCNLNPLGMRSRGLRSLSNNPSFRYARDTAAISGGNTCERNSKLALMFRSNARLGFASCLRKIEQRFGYKREKSDWETWTVPRRVNNHEGHFFGELSASRIRLSTSSKLLGQYVKASELIAMMGAEILLSG